MDSEINEPQEEQNVTEKTEEKKKRKGFIHHNKDVVVIKHLPRGFFEPQLKSFFSQICTVRDVRLFRNPKTKKPRGIAFVRVEDPEYVDVFVQELNYYPLGKKILRCQKCKPTFKKIFKNRKMKVSELNPVISKKNYLKGLFYRYKRKYSRPFSQEKVDKFKEKLNENETARMARIKEKGINYHF